MEIIGTLIDSGTREYVKNASIKILDTTGRDTGQGFPANNIGSFVATVPIGAQLLISHVNYYPVKVKADFFDGGAILEMDRKVAGLDEVVVTATKKKKQNNWLLWVVGGVVVSKLLKIW